MFVSMSEYVFQVAVVFQENGIFQRPNVLRNVLQLFSEVIVGV